jgi:uncharacterized membrane protein YfcA
MGVTFFEYPDPLIWWHLVLFYVAVAWGSFIIGVFGVGGGAVFVPVLSLLPGFTPQIAIGTVFAGAVPMISSRVIQLHRAGRLEIRKALPLIFGAALGALGAQLSLKYIPSVVSFLIISVLAITAGVQIQMKIMRAWAQKHKKQIENSTTDNGKDATQPAGGPVQEIVADSHTAESAPVAQQSASEVQIDCKVDVLVVESDSCIANTQCQLEGNAPANASAPADTQIVSTAQIDLQVQGNAGAAESMPSTALDQVGASCASPKRPSQMGINAGEIQSARQKLLMFSTGLIGGYLSSLSGTGGPLILFPLWTLLDPRISMKTLVSYSTPFAFTLVCFSFVGALLWRR